MVCIVYVESTLLKRQQHLIYLKNPGIVTQVPVGGIPPPESEIAQSLQLMIDDGTEVLAVETTDFFVDVDKP